MSNDGGPAFPCEQYEEGELMHLPGMSLRDYFAAKVLAGMVAANVQREIATEIKKTPQAFCLEMEQVAGATNYQMAKLAYELADAMLAERDKSGEGIDPQS